MAPMSAARSTADIAESDESASLQWTPCGDDAALQCARLTVPRDYADPSGGQVHLLVRRLPAASSAPTGIVVTNPGGPGGSAADALRSLGSGVIHEQFDIVSWDPRGIGNSSPTLRQCPVQFVGDGGLPPATGPVSWHRWGKQAYDRNARANRICRSRNRDLLSYVATTNTVKDLERLRVALGQDRLNYVGMSYGTTIGRLYATAHPGRIRTMVLDGVVGPDPRVPTVLAERRHAMRVAWRMVSRALEPDLRRGYARITDRLLDRGSGKLDRVSFWSGAINASRSPFNFGVFRLTLCQSMRELGLGFPPSCRASMSATSSRQGSPALPLIDCGDQSGRISRDRITRLASHAAREGAQFGAFTLQYGTLCAGLPQAWNPLPVTRHRSLSTPPLLLNGTGDVATPMAGAWRTRRAFPGARMIRAVSSIHVLLEQPSPCIARRLMTYLVSRRLPGRDVTCAVPGLAD